LTNCQALYSLISSTPPFTPALTFLPNDFVLGLKFAFDANNSYGPIAVDGNGSVWIANPTGNSLLKLSSFRVLLSGAAGFTSTGRSTKPFINCGGPGNAWLTSEAGGGSVVEFSNSGAVLSGESGYVAGGLSSPVKLRLTRRKCLDHHRRS
jgi:hypothetical protein